ncbi:ATP-binding SpoIIE family protein phosphatase [Streptomyces sp. AgN23]|uniref:ATP-binding SpoIIE family protein phosphatase n=1 Tax=Streptomyces sp. AgN23 TaxID=1188315 RepID=UPI001B341822|nr:ATP-binding SpoIIE family protein phosphatase [Streptomyces sp. AgN23]QTI87254.1 SpoIIE family protein phosphatase [Streptomyces sp. AgN23]
MREADIQKMISDDPALVLYVPFPMFVASAPLRTPEHRFGSITLRWVPPRLIDAEALQYLTTVSDSLALDLQTLSEQGVTMEVPFVPLFVSVNEPPPQKVTAPAADARNDWQAAVGSSATASTFIYQLLELASELTAAVRPRDVVSTAWTQVAQPLGGRAVMLCLVESARLHVVGSAGFPKEAVRHVNGLPLSRHTPEADAVVKIAPMFFETAEDLRASYPGLDRIEEGQSWAFLPLIADGRAVGCCVLVFDQPRRLRFEERALLMIMLGQMGQSLEKTRAFELEHALAQSLQQGLLPRSLPHLAEVDITARYLPTTAGPDVGGDWYDVLPLPGRGVGFVIGDVEGHSLRAAGIMGQIRTAVRSYAAEGHDPSIVLSRSNRLIADLDIDLFATCCCLWLDLDTGGAMVASAGHYPPVMGGRGGLAAVPDPLAGPPLGVDPEAVYPQTEIELSPGEMIALYTDGLLDARHVGADAAVEQLSHRLAEGSSQNLEVVADQLIGVSRPQALREDDAALLLLRYEGTQERPHRRVARAFAQRHDLQRVGYIRDTLRNLLRAWDLDTVADDLELLTSEVVTNALIHAHSEVDVRFREYPDRLRVEVRDSDPHPPIPVVFVGPDEPGNQEAESGRGLLIVDALASAWGSSPTGRGKTTWFELKIPPAL